MKETEPAVDVFVGLISEVDPMKGALDTNCQVYEPPEECPARSYGLTCKIEVPDERLDLT